MVGTLAMMEIQDMVMKAAQMNNDIMDMTMSMITMENLMAMVKNQMKKGHPCLQMMINQISWQ
eukprot:12736319-Prorocentrum_lima.AAC.1